MLLINPYFVVPSIITDPSFSSVSLLLHGDGSNGGTTFTDSSSNNRSPTVGGGITTSTTQSKFGGASIYPQAGKLSYASNAHFAISTFTAEYWLYLSSSSLNFCHVAIGTNNSNYLKVVTTSAGKIRLQTATDANGGETNIDVSEPSLNTWHHVALVRSGGTFNLYVDGSSVGSSVTTNFPTGNCQLIVADSISGGETQSNAGYIDDFRHTRTARYTGAFTPPTEAFPNS